MSDTVKAKGRSQLISRDGIRRYSGVWAALVVLFLACFVWLPGSVSPTALNTMLPFASVLVVASLGQALVVQQKGIDLSVPAGISMSAVWVASNPGATGFGLVLVLVIAVLLGAVLGLVNSLIVRYLSITPLIATLATNTVGLGIVYAYSRGIPGTAPAAVRRFTMGDVLGVPNMFIIAVVLTLALAWVVRSTVRGRQLIGVGVSPSAARIIGIRAGWVTTTAYVIAGSFYGIAGILIAGYLESPQIFVGNEYMLSTVAAVVLGGSPLIGGIASFLATFAGALLLSQLNIALQSMGATYAVQVVSQAALIALAVSSRRLVALLRQAVKSRRRVDAGGVDGRAGTLAEKNENHAGDGSVRTAVER